jgi:hypothetical protein
MSEAQETTVQVDGEALPFDAETPFANITDELKKKIGPERVVTEIYIDGRSIDIDEEDRLQATALKEMGQLRFVTKEVGGLLKDSLNLAPQICDALSLDCDDIEQFFATGDFVSANNRVAELSSLVDWMLQMIASLQSYGTEDFRDMEFEGTSVLGAVKKMDQLLSKLHEKLQQQNFDEFRSTLKDEFKPELKVWKALFTEASSRWTPRSLQRDS